MAVYVCAPDLQRKLQRALLSGRDYQELGRKLRQNRDDLDDQLRRYRDTEDRLKRIEAEIKRNEDDKNRPDNKENANIDRRNNRERDDLRDALGEIRSRIDELKSWEFRYQQQRDQIKRDIYL